MEPGGRRQTIRMVEPMPSYSEVLVKSFTCMNNAIAECKDCGLELSKRTLLANASLSATEGLMFLLCAAGWTLLRKAASRHLFQPFAQWCDLQPRDAAKMPESMWKLMFYTASWSYTSYLLFFTDYPFFHDPPSVFYEWRPTNEVPKDMAIAYLVQCSFYGHAIYATIYMDAWRKDSVVMLVHHVITLALIAFSYAFRFWFRLYWFPLKVLYATCYSSLQSVPNIPFYFFFNILLLALTLMNIYWFLYILLLVLKVLTGRVAEVNDAREYDVEDTSRPAEDKEYDHPRNSAKDGWHQRNGIIKDKWL
ncbi:ceramide synthase 1 isoform X2 [Amblyraja radiata]|uniref:ceramide synthase 1 isoform X2 n=1 Tax=Amblyraja radiata TaxID=386614 RepID=UPI0014021A27|nr:ceramide synthase 1 isoform X2 [Amblyraja radiata]